MVLKITGTDLFLSEEKAHAELWLFNKCKVGKGVAGTKMVTKLESSITKSKEYVFFKKDTIILIKSVVSNSEI